MSIHSWKLEECIPDAAVYALITDRSGHLWAGTGDGLALFSGVAWRRVPVGPGPRTFHIRCLLAGSDGSLWVGTDRDGLWRLKEGRWTAFNPVTGTPLPSLRVQTLLETREESGATRLWAGTGRGLVTFDGRKWQAHDENLGLPRSLIWRLALLRTPGPFGGVWVATSQGVYRFTGTRWELAVPGPIGKAETNDILETRGPEGQFQIWLSQWNAGLARWDGRTWTRLGPQEGFPSAHPTGLAQSFDALGAPTLWVSTFDAGLGRFDGRWQFLGRESGFPSVNIISLLAVPSGKPALLAGTRNASIQAVDPSGWSTFGSRQGLPEDLISCFAEEPRPNGASAMWVGTLNGLARWEANREIQSFTTGLPSTYFYSLLPHQAPSGQELWAATLRGVQVFDGRKWRRMGRQEGFPEGPAYHLLETEDHTLWVTFSKAVARREKGIWIVDTAAAALGGATPTDMKTSRDAEGTTCVWLATQGDGIHCFRKGAWQRYGLENGLPSLRIQSLLPYTDPRGRAWMLAASDDGSLVALPLWLADGKWTVLPLGSQEGFQNIALLGLVTDRHHRIYATSVRGVLRITLACEEMTLVSTRIEVFSPGDGLPSRAASAIRQDSLGRIWVGTSKGVAILEPELERPSPPALAPTFFRVEQLGTSKEIPDGAELPYHRSQLSFEFGLPLHHRFEDTLFRTQLVGLEEPGPWRRNNLRELAGLRAGAHVLRVWARDYTGAVSGPAEFHFRVRPSPWLRGWALSLYALGLGGLAVLGSQFRVRLLRRRAKELEGRIAAALAEVKTLEGFIPICAYCKKIRDDRGYWDQVEHYISQHAEVQFSHGVCPDCAVKLRAEFTQLESGDASS